MKTVTLAQTAAEKGAKKPNPIVRHPSASVIVLMFAMTWAGLIPMALASRGLIAFQMPLVLELMLGWTPALAAIVIAAVVSGKAGIKELLSRFLIVRVGIQWYVLALFGIGATILGGIGLYVLLGGTPPVITLAGVPIPSAVFAFGFALVLGVLFNTEEVAWRGFILPRLQARHTALIASLLIAIPETVYHLPYFFDKSAAFYQNVGIVAFSAMTVIETVLFTWVFNSTRGSLVIVTLLHASQNAWANLLSDNQAAPFYWNVLLLGIAAGVVIVVFGATYLARPPIARRTGLRVRDADAERKAEPLAA